MKIYIFIIFIVFNSCAQNIINQGKIEWISKYDLYENIYGKGIESKRGLNVTKFLILDESIIFIAAEKDSYFFDTKEDNAILLLCDSVRDAIALQTTDLNAKQGYDRDER